MTRSERVAQLERQGLSAEKARTVAAAEKAFGVVFDHDPQQASAQVFRLSDYRRHQQTAKKG